MESKLKLKYHKDGHTHLYWGRRDITALWMNFFSDLPMDKEKDCEKIFVRRYGKKLDAKLI